MQGSRFAVALVGTLAALGEACGGGDGGTTGGGGTAGPGGTPGGGTGGLTVTVDKQSISLAGIGGGISMPTARVNFTLQNGSGTYYGVTVVNPPLLGAALTITSTTTAYATLTPIGGTSGTGTVSFRLCRDPACSSIAWSKTIPFSVKVFTVAAQPMSISGYEGAASTPQTIAISPPDVDGQLTISTETAWLTASRTDPSAFSVTASGQGLLAGSYQGRVLITSKDGGGGQGVFVTFSVARGLVPPPPATTIVSMGPEGATTGSLQVAFNGEQSPTWSATTTTPWLALDPASGPGAGALTYTIDTTKLDALPNWTSDVATVEVRSPGMTPVTTQVTVRKELPEVYTTSPAAVAPGTGSTVRVFGRGLSQLGSGGISIAGAGASLTAVTDREAVVAVPPLEAGRHAVSVPNPFALPTATAALTAIGRPSWTAAFVADPGEKRLAFFDPTRNAVFAVDRTDRALVKFQLGEGGWQTSSRFVDAIGDAGPSPDWSAVYFTVITNGTYGEGFLRTADPDTLDVGTEALEPPVSWNASLVTGRYRTDGIQVTNDGRLWFNTSSWSPLVYFDTARSSFGRHPALMWSSVYCASVSASSDGSHMVVAQPNGAEAYFFVAAGDEVFQPTAMPSIYSHGHLNRNGTRMIYGQTVYETAAWSGLGRAAVAGTPSATAELSPDGTRVYSVVQPSGSTAYDRIDVFDTTATAIGDSTYLAKLGEIALTDLAADCASDTYECSRIPLLVVAPAGDVLFLVGNKGLVVVPIPPALRGGP